MNAQQPPKFSWNPETRDMCFGALCFVFFAGMFLASSTIKIRVVNSVVSAAFFPQWVTGIAAALSLALIVQSAMKLRRKGMAETGNAAATLPIRWGMLAFSTGLMTAYLLLIDVFGFIICSIAYMFIQILVLQKNRNKKTVLLVAGISVFMTMVLYLPFRYIFLVMLPMGIFR